MSCEARQREILAPLAVDTFGHHEYLQSEPDALRPARFSRRLPKMRDMHKSRREADEEE